MLTGILYIKFDLVSLLFQKQVKVPEIKVVSFITGTSKYPYHHKIAFFFRAFQPVFQHVYLTFIMFLGHTKLFCGALFLPRKLTFQLPMGHH